MRDNIILPYRSPSDHLHDRVTCTHEVPPSSELQSIDPVHVKEIRSSAALTAHLALSPTESGLATYQSVSDCKNECEYDDIADTYRNSRPASEGYSDIHESAQENTVVVSGEKGKQQPTALCDKKEENKDHLYAVVHKERKGRASSEASALKKSSYHPQEEISGLPVNRRSCVDCIGCSSHPTESGLDNNTEAPESETTQAGASIKYLYAAVNKTKKKKKQPPALCDKKENKDHVYAVVHKERKGRASSEASALKNSSYHPQEGTCELPVNRGSCVDCTDFSSHPTESGLDNNTNAAESETPQAGGSIEYLYAAIDEIKKEKKQPQVIHFTNPEYTSFYLLIFFGHEDLFYHQRRLI